MTSPLDMALDDLIKSNKKPSSAPSSGAGNRGRGRGRGGAGAGGPARRFSANRSANRSAPYSVGKAPDAAWQYDMHPGQIAGGYAAPAARVSSIETGVKLHISNLDYGVSNEDIKELFSEVGDLKNYSINYDRSGRSKGTAEVVFSRRADALAAISRYNNVQLDGKPMKIELVVPDVPPPAAPLHNSNANFANLNGVLKSGIGRPSGGWSRGGGGGGGGGGGRGRGRGRGRGKPRNEPVSAAALDADLDKYHSEAMQTN